MAGPAAHKQRDPQRLSMLAYGLLFGPALGMLVAVVFLGSEEIPLGLVVGAGVGVLCGVIWDSGRERRRGS